MNVFTSKSESEITGLGAHSETQDGRERDQTTAVVRDMAGAEDTDLAVELAERQNECQRLEAQVNAQA
jgi:hypothetical protein